MRPCTQVVYFGGHALARIHRLTVEEYLLDTSSGDYAGKQYNIPFD